MVIHMLTVHNKIININFIINTSRKNYRYFCIYLTCIINEIHCLLTKKSGKLSQNEMDSALVGPPGLEPGTNGL